MPRAQLDRVTFAAGELAPTLHARSDLARFQSGLKLCENFAVLFEGGVTRCPGTRFVIEALNEAQKTAFVPFRLSGATSDSYMLAFNGGRMRLLQSGGVVETSPGNPFQLIIPPYTSDELRNLRFAQSGNDVFLFCDGYPPQVLTRVDHTVWTLELYQPAGGVIDEQNFGSTFIQASATTGNPITLTASNPIFTSDMVGGVFRLDEQDLSLVPLWVQNEALASNAQRRNAGNVYQATNSAAAGLNPPTHLEGDVSAGNGLVTWRFIHPGHGFVRIIDFQSPNSLVAEVLTTLPNSVAAAPGTQRWFPPDWTTTKGFPTLVSIADNRLLAVRHDEFWLSNTANPFDMTVTGEDDGALALALTTPDGSSVDIVWALNAGVLIFGTRDGEWIVRATNVSDPLTVLNTRPIPDTDEGSAPHIPLKLEGGIVFIGRSRRRLHYAKFDRLPEALDIDEVTLTARHILKGRAERLAWQRDPNRILWIQCEDGSLVGLAFLPKQQVFGWFKRPFVNGFVEEVAAIPSSDEAVSDVYLVVRRTINGITRRYYEMFTIYFEPLDDAAPTAEGAWFVDCGLRAVFPTPQTVINGLGHLEAHEVIPFVDGVQQSPKVVGQGQITLDRAGTDVLVGIRAPARIRTLRQNVTNATASTRGKAKRANKAIVDLENAAGGTLKAWSFDSDGNRWVAGRAEQLQKTGTLAPGAPMPLRTGPKRVTMQAAHGDEVELELEWDNAYPATILGCTPDVDFSED